MSHWLIVSASARALAQSCVDAGMSCDVIDPYSDADTQALARRLEYMPLDDGSFGDDLPARVAAMGGPWRGIVAGSGFERRPDLLDELRAFAPLVGNDSLTTRRCKTPAEFARRLQDIHVCGAPVRLEGQVDSGWLMKLTGGCGGLHVRPALDGESVPPGWYAQCRMSGTPASVLFLADGRKARIVGISRQMPGSVAGPFAWCGVVSDLPLEDETRAALEHDIDAMVREFGLRGVNGVDMIIRDGRHVVVEINPRPTATLALYDRRVRNGLFAAHVAACENRLDSVAMIPDGTVRGMRVVYAPEDIRIGAGIDWPDWCSDRPVTGSRVTRTSPLVTVHAAGNSADEVGSLLHERERAMLCMLGL